MRHFAKSISTSTLASSNNQLIAFASFINRRRTNALAITADSTVFKWILFAIALGSSTMALAEDKQQLSVGEHGCREFSSNFHRTVARLTEGNIVNSPLSAHIVLSYLFHGSDTHTAKEMIAGLHLSDTNQLHVMYKELMLALNSMDTVELSLANALFLQKDLKLLEPFQCKGTDFYNFTVENVDFGNNVEAAKLINDWVSKSTKEKINNIIAPDDINDQMKVVLVNAIYFKAEWLHQFNADLTQKRVFHTSKTSSKQVPTMYKEHKYFHGEIPSLKSRFLEIPYKEENMDLIIILPNEIDGLSFVEENFDWNAVVNAESSMAKTRLYLPRFKIEATIDLKAVLQELGFKTMFEDSADFSAMSALPLKVDSVIQKAFLDVNEIGSEAAASTVVRMMMKRSLMVDEPVEFVVDRPFVVAIRHLPNNIPLFISSVRDISAAPERDEL